jgi:hypothetical protein
MLTSLRAGLLGSALVAVVFASAAAQDHPAANLPVPRSTLTDAEQARAIQLANPQGSVSTASQLHPSSSRLPGAPSRVVVSRVQPVAADQTDQRLAVVTLYEYEGNTTVNRLVDVNTGAVLQEDRATHGAAPIAEVEGQFARQLLMADERVRKIVERYQGNARFDLLLTTSEDRSNPLYGKRVVSALVATPYGYLADGPRISVNLTDATVILEPR